MIICICHRVSDRDIAREAAAGCSFDELQFECGVGTRCGACLDSARSLHCRHACAAAERARGGLACLAEAHGSAAAA